MLRVAADAAVADFAITDAPIFVADPPDARIAVALETLVAIFHKPSGMTHLLASPAPDILEALSSGPADVATILARLSQTHDVAGADAETAIAARLDELEASGLISRA